MLVLCKFHGEVGLATLLVPPVRKLLSRNYLKFSQYVYLNRLYENDMSIFVSKKKNTFIIFTNTQQYKLVNKVMFYDDASVQNDTYLKLERVYGTCENISSNGSDQGLYALFFCKVSSHLILSL